MSEDWSLAGGQSAGGEDDVFQAKAGRVVLGTYEAQGFLVVAASDRFGRRYGHARLPLSAADDVSRNLHQRTDGEPIRWPFRGPVYHGDEAAVEELEVYIGGFSFSDTVRVTLYQAPPRPPSKAREEK